MDPQPTRRSPSPARRAVARPALAPAALARRGSARLALAALAVLAALAALTALAVLATPAGAQTTPYVTITSTGPLDQIHLGQDLSCQVHRTSEPSYQMFPQTVVPGDCGTFLVVDPATAGLLYAPDFDNHPVSATGTLLDPYTPFAPVSMSGVGGAGTVASPYEVTTVVDAGLTRIEQRDAYVAGDDFYTSRISVFNNDAIAHQYRLYRAADCYLQGSDLGFGFADPPGPLPRVACTENPDNTPIGRILMLIPHTPGAHYLEDHFYQVWMEIGDHSLLADTCLCDGDPPGPPYTCPGNCIDNGIALQWDFSLAAGGSTMFTMDFLFAVGPPPNDPPEATIVVDASHTTCEDSAVRFEAIATDPDGFVMTYEWAFGDAATAFGPLVQHTYETPGTYTVTLKVTDDKGAIGLAMVSVAAVGDPDCCPVLQPIQQVTIQEGKTVRVTLGATDWEDGSLSFMLGGPYPPAATLDNAGHFVWRTLPGSAGVYDFSVTVDDGQLHAPACPPGQRMLIEVLPAPPGVDHPDLDRDGIEDAADNCPDVANHDQADTDRDGRGNACTAMTATQASDPTQGTTAPGPPGDADNDGVPDAEDICPTVADFDQSDADGDAAGDACDGDLDGDGVPQAGPAGAFLDNCPGVANADQLDSDHDAAGDACDRDGVAAKLLRSGPGADGAPASRTHAQQGGLPIWLVLGGAGVAVVVCVAAIAMALRRRGG